MTGEVEGWLSKVDILETLLPEEKAKLAKVCGHVEFAKSDTILQQGAPSDSLYIVYEGIFAVEKDGVLIAKLAATHSQSEIHILRERALLEDKPPPATMSVVSEIAKCFKLSRGDFEKVLGPLRELLDR